MIYEISINVISDDFHNCRVIKMGEGTEKEAREVASKISGCDFMGAKDKMPIRIGKWDNIYSMRVTETTTFVLKVRDAI